VLEKFINNNNEKNNQTDQHVFSGIRIDEIVFSRRRVEKTKRCQRSLC